MHHSLKIKILDLDHIESIFGRDITDVEAEKIVGGRKSVKGKKTVKEKISVEGNKIVKEEISVIEKVCADDDYHCLMNVNPMPDLGSPPVSLLS